MEVLFSLFLWVTYFFFPHSLWHWLYTVSWCSVTSVHQINIVCFSDIAVCKWLNDFRDYTIKRKKNKDKHVYSRQTEWKTLVCKGKWSRERSDATLTITTDMTHKRRRWLWSFKSKDYEETRENSCTYQSGTQSHLDTQQPAGRPTNN